MGSFFSFVALLVADVIRPGWRDALCQEVSILDTCTCTVAPNNNLLSLAAADVSTTCPINTLTDLGSGVFGDCFAASNGVYCAQDCVIDLRGTAGLLTMQLAFSTTLSCGFDKAVDNINNPIQPEFDAGGLTLTGTGDTSGNVQLTSCGSIGTFLSGNPVGSCRCDLTSCGEESVSIICDPLGDWDGFNQCFPTSLFL